MTTIVMVEKKNGVEVAYDSKVSNGYSHDELEQPKVFSSQGITYGVAGAVGLANLLESITVQPPEKDSIPKEVDQWVQRVLIPAMRRQVMDYHPHSTFDAEWQVLVVVNKRVYAIGGDFSRVRNTSGRYAIGSGSLFARGALHAGASAKRAVEIAAEIDPWTGHEVKVINL